MNEQSNLTKFSLTHPTVNYARTIGGNKLTHSDIQILHLLHKKIAAKKIAAHLKMGKSNISRYIKKYKSWGIIVDETPGKIKFYSLNEDAATKIESIVHCISEGVNTSTNLPILRLHCVSYITEILEKGSTEIPYTKPLPRKGKHFVRFTRLETLSFEITTKSLIVHVGEMYGWKESDILEEMKNIAYKVKLYLENAYPGWKFGDTMKLMRKTSEHAVNNVQGVERVKGHHQKHLEAPFENVVGEIDRSKEVKNPLTGETMKIPEIEYKRVHLNDEDQATLAQEYIDFPVNTKKLRRLAESGDAKLTDIKDMVKATMQMTAKQASGTLTPQQSIEYAMTVVHKAFSVMDKLIDTNKEKKEKKSILQRIKAFFD